jgi:hypothetical protein
MTAALGNHVFDYGHKAAADQMRTSWEKLVQYAGTTYGQDIANELENKTMLVIPPPTYTQAVIDRNNARQVVLEGNRNRMQVARRQRLALLERAAAADPANAEIPLQIATLQNEIAQGKFEIANPTTSMELSSEEKAEFDSRWRTHRERTSQLDKHRGQAYSLIIGQCTQLLQDRMKQDADWTNVSTTHDPLALYTNKHILKALHYIFRQE